MSEWVYLQSNSMIRKKCACVCVFPVAIWIRGTQHKIYFCAGEISMPSTKLNTAALF